MDNQVINDALEGQLIEEDRVECRLEGIPDSVLDENVGSSLFSNDAWMFLETVLKSKEKNVDMKSLPP